MPGRHSRTSTLGGSTGSGKPPISPCQSNRPAYDVAGRVNDLINCYLITAGDFAKAYLPQVLIAVLLIAIMLLAAYKFIKD